MSESASAEMATTRGVFGSSYSAGGYIRTTHYRVWVGGGWRKSPEDIEKSLGDKAKSPTHNKIQKEQQTGSAAAASVGDIPIPSPPTIVNDIVKKPFTDRAKS